MKNVGLLLVALALVAVVLGAVTVGALYWYSEQQAEQKLQFYIRKLENRGIIIEEQPLQGFSDDEICIYIFWNDFDMEREILKVDHVYYDRGKRLLYFIRPYPSNGIKVEAFSCKWKITDFF